jgi:hypothetical protein
LLTFAEPNPDDFIIGDQELRVYRHAAAFLFVEDRAKDSQAAVFIGFAESLNQAPTENVHGRAFQPACARFRNHRHHFGSIALAQPFDQSIADDRGTQILVFDIDESLRRRDAIEKKLFDFSSSLVTRVLWLGARDGDLHVVKVGG